MSQYHPPYVPPNVTPYCGAPPDLLKPARRASVLMFVLGPLMLLCGGCFAGFPLVFSFLPPEQLKQMFQQLQNPANISPSVILPVLGAVIALPGIAMIVLAIFVRRGGRVATILSLVLVGLILAQFIIEVLSGLLRLTDPNVAMSLCMDVVLHAPFALLFFWLISAARASSPLKLAQQQYQAQYWQYQQQMQNYAGYGQLPPMGYPPMPGYRQPGQAPPQMPALGYPTSQGYAQAAPPPPAPPSPPPADPNAPPSS